MKANRDSNKVEKHYLKDNGSFPNNEKLPLLVYSGALDVESERKPASSIENLLNSNKWGGSWRNGIYSFHHYHSTAHEVLCVYKGEAQVQLGGDNGIIRIIKPGDVVIIPAGVAHKNLGSSGDFRIVGAYPFGQDWDMNYGKPEERPNADENIAKVPLPESDPIFGSDGPVVKHWIGTPE